MLPFHATASAQDPTDRLPIRDLSRVLCARCSTSAHNMSRCAAGSLKRSISFQLDVMVVPNHMAMPFVV
jgi:hypothetical protein